MPDEPTSTGATPSGSDPAAGATPGGQQGQQQTGTGATPEPGQGATPDTPLGDAGRIALERERDARRDAERSAAEMRKRINELEDAGKSDVDKLRAQLNRAQLDSETKDAEIAALRAENAARELDQLKREVAAEAGLPPSVASRLKGTDLRSLRSDAKSLADELGAGTPAGQIGIGRGGAAAGNRRVDMNQLIREAAGRG